MISDAYHKPTFKGIGTEQDPVYVNIVKQENGKKPPIPEWALTASAVAISVVISYFLEKYLTKKYGGGK